MRQSRDCRRRSQSEHRAEIVYPPGCQVFKPSASRGASCAILLVYRSLTNSWRLGTRLTARVVKGQQICILNGWTSVPPPRLLFRILARMRNSCSEFRHSTDVAGGTKAALRLEDGGGWNQSQVYVSFFLCAVMQMHSTGLCERARTRSRA